MQVLTGEQLKKLEKDMVDMAKDFIMYGECYAFFKTYDYPQFAIEQFGEEKLKKCWDIAFDIMTNE